MNLKEIKVAELHSKKYLQKLKQKSPLSKINDKHCFNIYDEDDEEFVYPRLNKKVFFHKIIQ